MEAVRPDPAILIAFAQGAVRGNAGIRVVQMHDPKIAAHTQRTINLIDGLVDNITHNGKAQIEKKVEYETL